MITNVHLKVLSTISRPNLVKKNPNSRYLKNKVFEDNVTFSELPIRRCLAKLQASNSFTLTKYTIKIKHSKIDNMEAW